MKIIFVLAFFVILVSFGIQESAAEEKISVQVDGGKLLNFEQIDELGSMNFEISTYFGDTASVTIELPKSVWHIADSECNPISPLVLVDGQVTTFADNFEKDTRIITIDVVGGSKLIELIVGGVLAPHTTSLMYGKFCFLKEQNIFLSPKKQLDLGFMFYDIQCKDNLVKIIKESDASRVCVEHNTAWELGERGWGKAGISRIFFLTDKTVYEIGEPITITMKNTGTTLLMGPSIPCGFRILSEDSQVGYIGDIRLTPGVVANFWGMFAAVCMFGPGEEITITWNAKVWSSGTIYVPVKPGIYTLQAKYSSHTHNHIFEQEIEIVDPNGSYELLEQKSESENIQLLKDSYMAFSGKISKVQPTSVPQAYKLKFEVIENFKFVSEDSITVFSNESVWKNCQGLEENSEYIVFVKDETMNCSHAISLPDDSLEELREFSSQISWWEYRINSDYNLENPPVSLLGTECENNGGKWLEMFQECEDITQNVCEKLGGQYHDCASACRNVEPRDETVICAQVCVRVCQFR